MGGELVNSPPPVKKTYGEQFAEHFPYYLALGMSAGQYWDGDSTLVRDYRKADKIRADMKNQEAWLHGRYVYDALCCASPILHAFAKGGTQPIPYNARPHALTSKQAAEQTEAEENEKVIHAASGFEIYARAFNKRRRENEHGEEPDVSRND